MRFAAIVVITPTAKLRTQSRCRDHKTAMSQVRNGAVDDSLSVPALLRLVDGWRRWCTGCAEVFRTLGCLYILTFQSQTRLFATCLQVAHCGRHRVLAGLDKTSQILKVAWRNKRTPQLFFLTLEHKDAAIDFHLFFVNNVLKRFQCREFFEQDSITGAGATYAITETGVVFRVVSSAMSCS